MSEGVAMNCRARAGEGARSSVAMMLKAAHGVQAEAAACLDAIFEAVDGIGNHDERAPETNPSSMWEEAETLEKEMERIAGKLRRLQEVLLG